MPQENTSSNSPSTGEQPAMPATPPSGPATPPSGPATPPAATVGSERSQSTQGAAGTGPTAPTAPAAQAGFAPTAQAGFAPAGFGSTGSLTGAGPAITPHGPSPQQGYQQQQGFASHSGFAPQQPGGQLGGQQFSGQQFSGPPPGYPTSGSTSGQGPLRPLGPMLMILGAVLAVVTTFLPWNASHYTHGPGGGMGAWNGWDQIGVNLHADRIYGALMLIAFVLAIVASLMVVIAAIGTLAARPAGMGLGVLGLIGAVIGLLGTLGVVIGYLALGATDEATFILWVYGFSYIPVLVGAIGVLSKKF